MFLRAYSSLLLVLLVWVVSVFAQEAEEHCFQKDIDAFEADRIENNLPEGAVLCVGSTSMRMWIKRMELDLEPLTVIPCGFGGSQFSDVLYSLLDDSGEPRPGIFLKDGLHLNTVGYNLWAAAFGLELIPAESEYELD